MRVLSESERMVCERQGSVFETSLRASHSSSAVFVRRFMRSAVARRIDDGGFLGVTETDEELVTEVEGEYGGAYGSDRYTPNELYWMGYVYRAWCLAYGQTSKAVYKKMGARDLRALYQPYHTLDVLDAIERIREAHGLLDVEYVSRGVELLRELRRNTRE